MSAYLKPADTKAVIDGLDELASNVRQYGVTLLTDKLAVGGWSGGSASTLRVAGAKYTLANGREFRFEMSAQLLLSRFLHPATIDPDSLPKAMTSSDRFSRLRRKRL